THLDAPTRLSTAGGARPARRGILAGMRALLWRGGALAEGYLVQFGHDAVSFSDPPDRASCILAPQDGQRRAVGAAIRRFTFSTTTGFVRPWLKLMRGSNLSFPISRY